MAVHVAIVKLVNVDGLGNVFDKQNSSIAKVMKSAGGQARVYEAEPGSAPNANEQTVTQYLIAENVDSFNLVHMDQTYIITSDVNN